MELFRVKKHRDTSSKKHVESGTLDSIHQTIIADMKQSCVESLRARERELCEQLDNPRELYRMTQLQSELREIRNRLAQPDPVSSYYGKHADIMLKYYGNTDTMQSVSMTPADQNTFVKYLHVHTPDTPNISKRDLYEEYTTRMKLNVETSEHMRVTEHCEKCNIARDELPDEGILVCPMCGSEEYMMVVSDFPSFRDPPKERNNYAYKKINHLNEILNQFQAKESTIIPEDVMSEVICEIKKRRIQNVAEMTEPVMREILKKLNRSKYYEHATHILSRLNGNPPPTITPEIEEKIRTMFQEIQAPFLLYCPDERTNFLSYSYILYKFFELLELDEYKVYFPLLKSRDRLIAHDQIWKKICEFLRWEFIPSV